MLAASARRGNATFPPPPSERRLHPCVGFPLPNFPHVGEGIRAGFPCFVVTHRPRAVLMKSGTPMTFVTDGIERALALAKEAAGNKPVIVMGGATIARQYITAGPPDELDLHVAHRLLGQGLRLFEDTGGAELQLIKTVESAAATHMRFRVIGRK